MTEQNDANMTKQLSSALSKQTPHFITAIQDTWKQHCSSTMPDPFPLLIRDIIQYISKEMNEYSDMNWHPFVLAPYELTATQGRELPQCLSILRQQLSCWLFQRHDVGQRTDHFMLQANMLLDQIIIHSIDLFPQKIAGKTPPSALVFTVAANIGIALLGSADTSTDTRKSMLDQCKTLQLKYLIVDLSTFFQLTTAEAKRLCSLLNAVQMMGVHVSISGISRQTIKGLTKQRVDFDHFPVYPDVASVLAKLQQPKA
ncbi:hypothetical protein G4V62_17800 [Bacillaceae bacterium SIJ1]|uniref:hypothetical protein n=1 Tax=Litoribacterium kuwaitense TaxID=1398745 RepID=UPI0013EAB112|nr:hypothetical protein [Litoribacterium kuwaitense]NGP46708.1 hypothetical protein [Litoribacterium kuwaitense]